MKSQIIVEIARFVSKIDKELAIEILDKYADLNEVEMAKIHRLNGNELKDILLTVLKVAEEFEKWLNG